MFDPFGKGSIFNEIMGLSFFIKLDFSFDKLVEGSDSSEFLFEKWAGDHLEVNLHFNNFAPILYISFDGGFSTDVNDLAN